MRRFLLDNVRLSLIIKVSRAGLLISPNSNPTLSTQTTWPARLFYFGLYGLISPAKQGCFVVSATVASSAALGLSASISLRWRLRANTMRPGDPLLTYLIAIVQDKGAIAEGAHAARGEKKVPKMDRT